MSGSNLTPRRCCIYTRKSSEEGLDQAFNSLHAQRDMCAAYVKSQTGEGWRRGLTIADRAREWASKTPDAVAIVEGDASLTYKQLFDGAIMLAQAFIARGLKPGHVISFQLPNWYEAMVINIAAALAGVIVNPIVPIFRDAEVGFILKDARSAQYLFRKRSAA